MDSQSAVGRSQPLTRQPDRLVAIESPRTRSKVEIVFIIIIHGFTGRPKGLRPGPSPVESSRVETKRRGENPEPCRRVPRTRSQSKTRRSEPSEHPHRFPEESCIHGVRKRPLRWNPGPDARSTRYDGVSRCSRIRFRFRIRVRVQIEVQVQVRVQIQVRVKIRVQVEVGVRVGGHERHDPRRSACIVRVRADSDRDPEGKTSVESSRVDSSCVM